MKAEVHIDLHEFLDLVTEAVRAEIAPLLDNQRSEPDVLLTVETLADYLNVSKQWVYQRINLNEIPYIKMGKFPRFRKSDIDAWLESFKIPVQAEIAKGRMVRVLKAVERPRLASHHSQRRRSR